MRFFLCLLLAGCLFALTTLAQPPAEWTCAEALYAGSDGCDCNCGAYDPDCNEISFIRGCDYQEDFLYFCDGAGECVYFQRDVPDAWFCPDVAYNNEDGICNCGCGAYDPDCDTEGAFVADCHAGLNPTCSLEGTCVYESPLPDDWVCSGYAYATGNGCDCSCGIEDPDCETQDEVFGCPCAEMECIAGYCAGFCNGYMLEVSEVSDELAARGINPADYQGHEESCSIEEKYRFEHMDVRMPGASAPESSDDLPFFDHRNIDRSVDESLIKEYIHKKGHSAHGKMMLHQWGFFDNEQTDMINVGLRPAVSKMPTRSVAMTPPPEWTCDAEYFDNQDGCDCNCGAYDPDCDIPADFVFGCFSGVPRDGSYYQAQCTAEAECAYTQIDAPEGWRCDPRYYGTADGCDCTCGIYDPDCDIEGQFVFNCNKGYEASCTTDTATCIYGEPVPDNWSCPYYLYDDGRCHCNCGDVDIDCTFDEITQVLGCGMCTDPAGISCVDPGLCVGECNGVLLDFEKLEYWNPLLQAGAPDVELIYRETESSDSASASTASSGSNSSGSSDSNGSDSNGSSSTDSSDSFSGDRESNRSTNSSDASTVAAGAVLLIAFAALM